MITISNGDLVKLLRYVEGTDSMFTPSSDDLHTKNLKRVAKCVYTKLMRREDVQRVMMKNVKVVVADK